MITSSKEIYMSTCFNCKETAVYRVTNRGSKDQLFCITHLPKFFNIKKHLGDVVHQVTKEEEVKPKKIKKETPAPVPAEPAIVVEPVAPVVEEVPAETLTEEV
jgi:hypothetical protein